MSWERGEVYIVFKVKLFGTFILKGCKGRKQEEKDGNR